MPLLQYKVHFTCLEGIEVSKSKYSASSNHTIEEISWGLRVDVLSILVNIICSLKKIYIW